MIELRTPAEIEAMLGPLRLDVQRQPDDLAPLAWRAAVLFFLFQPTWVAGRSGIKMTKKTLSD